jgi:hypothetical protein
MLGKVVDGIQDLYVDHVPRSELQTLVDSNNAL